MKRDRIRQKWTKVIVHNHVGWFVFFGWRFKNQKQEKKSGRRLHGHDVRLVASSTEKSGQVRTAVGMPVADCCRLVAFSPTTYGDEIPGHEQQQYQVQR